MKQGGAQAVDIGTIINLFATRFFRRYIIWCSPYLLSFLLLPHEACKPEVHNLGFTIFPEQDIGRLDVAMHKPYIAGRFQAFGNFKMDFQRPSLVNIFAAGNDVIEPTSSHQLHDDIRLAFKLAERINLHHVRVIQGRGYPRFMLERLYKLGILAKRFLHHLNGNITPKFVIPATIDNAHPSGPESVKQNKRTKHCRHGLFRAASWTRNFRKRR